MVVEKVLGNGLIERYSDKCVYIRNTTTGKEYAVAVVDWDDLNRIRRGQKPVRYVETDRIIKEGVDGG
jgi:hypothetical protein